MPKKRSQKVIRRPQHANIVQKSKRKNYKKSIFKPYHGKVRAFLKRSNRREVLQRQEIRKTFFKILDIFTQQKRKSISERIGKVKSGGKIGRSRKPKKQKTRHKGPLTKAGYYNKRKYKPTKNLLKNRPIYMFRIKGTEFIRKLINEYPLRNKRPSSGGAGFYGDYPQPLGIHSLFTIEENKRRSDFRSLLKFVPQLEDDIITEMIILQNNIFAGGCRIIENLTPKDTGDLIKSLEESIDRDNSIMPRKGKLILAMRFYSELPYSGIVNKMPKKSVQHPKSPTILTPHPRNRSWKTGQILYDPNAVNKFFYIEKYEIQSIVRIQMKHFFRNVSLAFRRYNTILNGTKWYNMTNKTVRSLFTISGLGRGI